MMQLVYTLIVYLKYEVQFLHNILNYSYNIRGTQITNKTYHTFVLLNSKPDKKFVAMFIGFIDGDVYLDISE